jgi:hypothetical protein
LSEPPAIAAGGRRVLLVCQLDGYANGWRPVEIQRYLERQGHEVRLVSTYYLDRASSDPSSPLRKLPHPAPLKAALYAVEVASYALIRRWSFGRRHLSYYAARADCRLRRLILGSSLPLDDFDLIIAATPHDAELVTIPTTARKLYDCQTPWADELRFEGKLTERQHRKLRHYERELLEGADLLSFAWESYARYAAKHYAISLKNLITLNCGCVPSDTRAHFDYPPRVCYLGSLSSRFIDLPLLSRLSRIYPHIDVYGGPPPPASIAINFKGWASPDILEQYQFGLITCTKDELRRDGFSAKHLQYLSHGLPVLVPAWRRNLDLLRGSVPYTENDFTEVVASLSNRDAWQQASDEAYAQARRLIWDNTLRPLDDMLRAIPRRNTTNDSGSSPGLTTGCRKALGRDAEETRPEQ